MIGTNNPRPALIASAKRVQLNRMQRVGEPWQQNLWDIYTNLGAVHYGMAFKRSAAMRINYFIAERVEDEDEPIASEDPQAIEALDRLGDVNSIVADFTVNINVAGEGYLWGDDDEDTFDVLSTVEVNRRRNDPQATISDEDLLLRLWLPAPYDRAKADSSLRSVQAQCEQLLLLNDQISATAMSRIPAGLLLIPEELSYPTSPDEYPDPDGDPFMAEIIEIATQAVSDPDSATRIAPNVIRGAAEWLKEVRYMDFSRSMDETFANMREELLRQIAGGVNLPAEILTGLADLNHWSLWGVDESTAKHHVDPDVLFVLQGLTDGYLVPALEEAGVADPRRFLIWRDYSDLVSRPLTVEQAMALAELGVVNDEYVRQVANVPDNYAGEGRPVVPQPINPDDDRAKPDTLVANAPIELDGLADIDRRLGERIIEASEAAFHRALERAGAIVRTKSKKNRDLFAAIAGVPNWDVTRHLGAQRVETLQVTPEQLIPADTFDPLRQRLLKMLEQGQVEAYAELERLFGVKLEIPPEVEEDRFSAVDLFIGALFAAATARLFTASPAVDPAETGEFRDEIATGQMVVELLTRAGGADVDVFTPETPRGLALGQRTRALLRDHGYRVETLEWKWGFYATPQTPFEPHQRLNGDKFLDPVDPRMDGYYPGDHPYCTCELVPAVLPVE